MEAIKGIYHPDKIEAEAFIANFTIRLKEFVNIIDNLKRQQKKPLQHFLITGKRGMGKSTLLRRVFLEAQQFPLNEKLVAVRLGSEQYKLSRLYKLWEEVIKNLSINDPRIEEKRKALFNEKSYEENVIQLIVDYLNSHNKTLLLLIDNFDHLIDKLTTKEQHALREILIQYPVQIIGNTVFYEEHFFSYNKPFYDFFKPIHLKNLDKREADEFIKQLAANEGIENFEELFIQQKGKIQTLRILSGGVPRTLVILLSILSKKNTGEAVDYLHEMLEQVTPLYQDRMKALSSQQQEIMHHLAIHWDRTPVKELAKEMRLPSKSISAQLSQLEDSGYINKTNTSNRNLLYEIDERFFNIWLLMSEASAYDAKRVIWLTRWLDMFYDSKELEDYAFHCNNSLKKTKPGNRFLIMQALSESEHLSRRFKDKLVNETAKDLEKSLPEIKDWLMDYNRKKTVEINALIGEIKDAINKKQFSEALSKLNELKELDEYNALSGMALVYEKINDCDNAEKYYLLAVDQNHPNAITNLGAFYARVKKDYVKAEKYSLLAASSGKSIAMYNLGFLYQSIKKDYESAEKYYLMAIAKGNTDAMYSLGYLYDEIKKDYTNAEKYYLMAVENGEVDAMFKLGSIYDGIKKDYENAEKYYLMAIEKGNTNAMFSLGSMCQTVKHDYINAEKYYLMAIEKDDVDAMFNLGLLYHNIKHNYLNAEKYYLMAVEKGDVEAMFNLGYLYHQVKKDYANAEKYFLMAVEKGDANTIKNLALFYFLQNKHKKKNETLALIEGIDEKDLDDDLYILKIQILLWNEKIKDAQEVWKTFFDKYQAEENAFNNISQSLISFLFFKQRQFLYETFTQNITLKDQFKPVYFALMHEMQTELPDEYLKMPQELDEPVTDILAFVKEERERLGIN